ncbi:MAG: preQ(1) synthase [Pseudomonadota bacterium]
MKKRQAKKTAPGPDSVDRGLLVTKPYAYAGRRDVEVLIEQPEFTSLCPMTGLPDFGTITITYAPGKKIVELKSLKLYLLQYRQVGIFYEHAVNRILDDLIKAAAPQWMEVRAGFTARGGMTTSVTAFYEV